MGFGVKSRFAGKRVCAPASLVVGKNGEGPVVLRFRRQKRGLITREVVDALIGNLGQGFDKSGLAALDFIGCRSERRADKPDEFFTGI